MTDLHASIHRTLAQARARAGWQMVRDAKKRMSSFKEYVSLVKGFPADIMRNGLGQSVAFLASETKANSAKALLLAHLSSWLVRSDYHDDLVHFAPPYETSEKGNFPKRLLDCIMNQDSYAYRVAGIEALHLLDFLRKFAEGMDISDNSQQGGPS